MNILFASSEISPYAKTGGLGDVLAALPATLRRRGHSVACVLPMYRGVLEKVKDPQPSPISFKVQLGGSEHTARIWTAYTDAGVRLFLVQRDEFYDRSHLYGGQEGDYADNASRFIFFNKAVVELAKFVRPITQILHVHDWQTGLVPAFVRTQGLPFKTVYTIHNLAYQGAFWGIDFGLTNLPGEYFSPPGVEFYGQMNCMKAGITLAHQVTTVSPRYAQEIQTEWFGCGLHRVLQEQRHKLSGILNGVDYDLWDPGTDRHLVENYTGAKLKGKSQCKAALLSAMGLPPSEAPLFVSITRLAHQKGADLIAGVVESIVADGGLFILLGSGDRGLEDHFRYLAHKYPNQVAVKIGFDEPLSHQIEAGGDFFLMPSLYEPCGLTQMYSLRYGTLPIVHDTGGLADSVVEWNPDTGRGNGFLFQYYGWETFMAACRRALALYPNKADLLKARREGMKAQFSWDRSAEEYEKVYQAAIAS